jgi:YidC/Oxa1 family membrane protein insertase
MNNFGNNKSSDSKRLILAISLMTGLLICYSYFFIPQSTTLKNESLLQNEEGEKKINEIKITKKEKFNNNNNNHILKSDIPKKTEIFVLDIKNNNKVNQKNSGIRGGYSIVLNNIGGKIESITLDGYEKKIELVNKNFGFFDIESSNREFLLDSNDPYRIIKKNANKIVFGVMTPEGVFVKRIYEFSKDRFWIDQKIVIENRSSSSFRLDLDFIVNSSKEDLKKSSFLSQPESNLSSICHSLTKSKRIKLVDLKNKDVIFSGNMHFVGLDERYFLTAIVPKKNTKILECEFRKIRKKNINILQLIARQESLIIKSGQSKTFDFGIYAGPKQLELLKQAGHFLEDAIDFGFMASISRPMQWLLIEINKIVKNFGIAIIILTFFVKLATYPFTRKSYISMQAMKNIQPEIQNLQKKYKGDKAALGRKQMELYRKHGVNPMAGCLPMLIQMPIWIALYQMLWGSVELYQQPFFAWIDNLTSPDSYYILPIAMGVSMLLQQFLQPMPEQGNSQMKFLKWGMPIFFTFIMLNLASGLSLYVLTNSILTILQQIYINKKYSLKK